MSFQIVYYFDQETRQPSPFPREYRQLARKGFPVTTEPGTSATRLLYRCPILTQGEYPKDQRYIGTEKTYQSYSKMLIWYPMIEDLTIPTFFAQTLNDEVIDEIQSRGWKAAFIKDSVKSLFVDDAVPSTWPSTPLDEISRNFQLCGRKEDGFSIRQYLEPQTFEEERRYWVMNHKIHHSSGVIPEIVREAASRLDHLGGLFYTIDATPSLVVEINPGESSDRKTDNTQDDFIRWIMNAFDN